MTLNGGKTLKHNLFLSIQSKCLTDGPGETPLYFKYIMQIDTSSSMSFFNKWNK